MPFSAWQAAQFCANTSAPATGLALRGGGFDGGDVALDQGDPVAAGLGGEQLDGEPSHGRVVGGGQALAVEQRELVGADGAVLHRLQQRQRPRLARQQQVDHARPGGGGGPLPARQQPTRRRRAVLAAERRERAVADGFLVPLEPVCTAGRARRPA
jgi:hypothetical protein